MRILILLLILTCTYSNSTTAQNHEWAPIGAEWYYTHTYFQPGPPIPSFFPDVDYNKVTCIGDTMVGGKYCKRLFFDKANCNLWNLAGSNPSIMHQDSGKIYHWNIVDSSFSLFIDFNANAGDTWEMPLWEHNFLSIPYHDTVYVHVDSVKYLHINSDSLKQLYVTYTVYSTLGQSLFVNANGGRDVITERLGPTSKMFPIEHGYCDAEYDKDLRCYNDSSLGFQSFVPYSCDTSWYIMYSSTDVLLDEQGFQVYPNPTEKEFSLDLGKTYETIRIEIYNPLGEMVFSRKYFAIQEIKLELEDAKGLYFIKVKTEEGISTLKVVGNSKR